MKQVYMSQEDFQQQVLSKFDNYEGSQQQILQSLDQLKTDVEKSNDKFEVYRQATQSLVNLAFGLIASAIVITIVSAVFKR
jgi:hypothetical protein